VRGFILKRWLRQRPDAGGMTTPSSSSSAWPFLLGAAAAVAMAAGMTACGGGEPEPVASLGAPLTSSASAETVVEMHAALSAALAEITPVAAPTERALAVVAGSNCGLASFQAELMQRINAYRARGATCGSYGSFAPTTALAWNDLLQSAAARHSSDMASHNFFSHTGSDGSNAGTRITQAGYAWRTWGENIGAGYATVQAVVDSWMASPGHCANLMKPAFRHVGVACVSNNASSYHLYWTLALATPR
jgi:uncharacterized protein YkwD